MQCTGGGADVANFRVWYPDRIEGGNFIWPARDARYLWHDTIVSSGLFLLDPPRPGDVWLCPQIDRLFFIGPLTSSVLVHVLADWVCDETTLGDTRHRIFQRDPEQIAPPSLAERPVSALVRLLRDDELV
jgi:hypothetical protein